jgi:23S rRNA (adenine2503-C2)-methyltransferase
LSKPSIFSHTQESYCGAMFDLFGKGRQHAARLYSDWFRKGHVRDIEQWAEPQALALVRKMIQGTDFTFPEMSAKREEGGTVKFLLKFSDGLESESVLIPMGAGTTICISSQVGCRMGCAFCETGKMGLLRHLSCEEIVAQVFCARFGLYTPNGLKLGIWTAPKPRGSEGANGGHVVRGETVVVV